MNYDSFSYSGTKSIDYRNARYQGLASKNNKRQGFGIMLDDDLNLYCSQWNEGQLNGKTLILLRNGRYLYGNWLQGQPQGGITFKSKKIMLYANYYKGKARQKMVSFYEPTNNVFCFYAQEMQKNCNFQLISTQTLNNLQLYKQYMSQITTKRCGIFTNIEQITVLDFMRKLASKYHFLLLKQKGQVIYFGFEKGLGIKFTLSGTIDQHVHQISIGNHISGDKLIQIGAKYHLKPECTEQGNFQTRQLISYNRFSQRPQQKCHLIFQNTHKKGLYFRNQYFDVKTGLIQSLQQFCSKRLVQKYEQIQTEMKQLVKSSQISRSQSNLAIQTRNGRRKSELLKQRSMENLNQKTQKSAKKLVICQDRKKPNYSNMNTYTQQNEAVNQLIKNYNQLRYKKAHHCDRSHSKTPSPNKSINKLSKLKLKSKDIPKQGISPIKKQIKHLRHKVFNKESEIKPSPKKNTENDIKNKESANPIKNYKLSNKSSNKSSNYQREQTKSIYKQQQKNKKQNQYEKTKQQRQIEEVYRQKKIKDVSYDKNRNYSQHSIKKKQKEKNLGYKMQDMIGVEDKQQINLNQYQIQLKIRQQLFEQERYRQLKNRQMSQFLFQRQRGRSKIQLESIQSPAIQTHSYKQRDLKTKTQNFDSYLQDLQSKRQKLLRDFRKISQQMSSNFNPSIYRPISSQRDFQKERQTNSIYTQQQSPRKQYYQQENIRRKQESIKSKLTNHMYKINESTGSDYRAQRAPLANAINSVNLDQYEQNALKEFYGARKKKYEYLFQ